MDRTNDDGFDLELFRAGNEDYFRTLINEHHPLVWAVAVWFAEGVDEAEDLVQEIWLKVFRSRASYTGRGSFAAWLHTVAMNVCRMNHRKKARRLDALAVLSGSTSADDNPFRSPLTKLLEKERRAFLKTALRRVAPREREAVQLRVFEGKSYREVGAEMGIADGSARTLVFRAVGKMRDAIKEANYDLP